MSEQISKLQGSSGEYLKGECGKNPDDELDYE